MSADTIISTVKGQKEQESLKSSDLLGIRVDHFALNKLSSITKNAHIVTLNFEMFVEAQSDSEFKEIINNADLVIADGVFISFLILILTGKRVKKITGIDLAEKLIEKTNKVALLGAKSSTLELVKKNFSDKIVFAHHGFFEENSIEEEKIIQNLEKSSPELFLVALGSPKQEKFISRNQKTLAGSMKIGVGGAFDIWSKEKKRAPKWMISLHLEWFFRIIQEPYRLKRFFYNVCKFFSLLFQ